jgi:hypothetical protein
MHQILTYYKAFGLELDVKKEQRGRGVSGLPRRGEKNLEWEKLNFHELLEAVIFSISSYRRHVA